MEEALGFWGLTQRRETGKAGLRNLEEHEENLASPVSCSDDGTQRDQGKAARNPLDLRRTLAKVWLRVV